VIAAGLVALLFGQQTVPWAAPLPPGAKIVDGDLVIRGVETDVGLIVSWKAPALPSPRFVLKTSASGEIEGAASFSMTVFQETESGLNAGMVVRTVDTGGPMARLKGRFFQRAVELPITSDPQDPPDVVSVHLQFDGKGEVRLRPFVVEPWQRTSLTGMAAGLAGAILGVLLGLLGGIYALLAAVPGARRIAYQLGRILCVLGVVLLAAAVVFYLTGWPFGIWVSMAAAGALSVVGFGGTLGLVRKGIADADRLRTDSDGSLEPI
jgi:hypothetical protein